MKNLQTQYVSALIAFYLLLPFYSFSIETTISKSMKVKQQDTIHFNPEFYGLKHYLSTEKQSGPAFVHAKQEGSIAFDKIDDLSMKTRSGAIQFFAKIQKRNLLLAFSGEHQLSNYTQLHFISVVPRAIGDPQIKLIESYQIQGDLAFLNQRNFVSCQQYPDLPPKNFDFLVCVHSDLKKAVIIKIDKQSTKAELHSNLSISIQPQSETAKIQFTKQKHLLYASEFGHLTLIDVDIDLKSRSYGVISFKKTGEALQNIDFDIEKAKVSDLVVSTQKGLIFVVLRYQGILVFSLDKLDQGSVEQTIHDFVPLKNARKIAINPAENTLAVTTVPKGDVDSYQWGDVYEYQIAMENQKGKLKFNKSFQNAFKCNIILKNGACKHQIRFPVRHLALVIAPVSFAFGATLPKDVRATSLGTIGAFTAAQTVIFEDNYRYFGVLSSSSLNYNSQSYNLILNLVRFDQYKISISPTKQFIGNFDAKLKIVGQDCNFLTVQKAQNPDQLCVLNANLSIEVYGLEVATQDWVLIGVLSGVVVIIVISIIILVARMFSLKRKNKKMRYQLGLSDQIQMQYAKKNDDDATGFDRNVSYESKQNKSPQKIEAQKVQFQDNDLEQPQQGERQSFRNNVFNLE